MANDPEINRDVLKEYAVRIAESLSRPLGLAMLGMDEFAADAIVNSAPGPSTTTKEEPC